MDEVFRNYGTLSEQDLVFPAADQPVLPGTPAPDPNMYIGFASAGRTEFVGTLYPANTPEKDFLKNYVEHFNAIEFTATYNKSYTQTEIKKWADLAADKEFLFCPRMYHAITERGSLTGKELILQPFLQGLQGFAEHLGPVSIKLPGNIKTDRADELYAFIKELPAGFAYYLDPEHESWFSNNEINNELCRVLKESGIGLVTCDNPNRMDKLQSELLLPDVFIQFYCPGNHALDAYRVKRWKEILSGWYAQGLKNCYFFIHPHDNYPDIYKIVKEEFSTLANVPVQKGGG